MPSGSRVIANNAYGATVDSPLTAGATSFNSLQLQLLPAIISPSQYAVVVLDPRRVNGEPEIVVVTNHTFNSTTATITRGAYGTTARSHPSGSAWAHVTVDEDVIEILTSTTRPLDPYLGQFIFETNTVSRRFYNGSGWNSSPAIGSILMFLGSVAPSGYLFADGSAVSRTGTTADLFATIGTTYGVGDGVSTYNLPNLKGRIPVGRRVTDPEFDVLGETGGEKTVALDSTKIPQHLHPIIDFQHRHGETSHDHSKTNFPLVGFEADHVHGGSISPNGFHDHQTTGPGQAVMVIAAGAGPFNVSAPGTDFVTFDVGGSARTSANYQHSHSFSFGGSGNIMQPVKTGQQPAFTTITATNNTASSPTPTHNNLQPYIVINYIIKI